MEYRFYHLTKSTLPHAVVRLAQKVEEQGQYLQILCNSEARIQEVDDALWSDAEFLPHSVGAFDGVSKIAIGKTSDAAAEISFVLDDAEYEGGEDELTCYLFHSLDLDIVAHRRQSWKEWSKKGIYLTYWSENENGKWEKSAEVNG